MPSPVVMQLFVSFGDHALEVVANTRGCHLLLLQLDLCLLARQAAKFLVLIARLILSVIREKSTTEQLLSWDTGEWGREAPCYKEFHGLIY